MADCADEYALATEISETEALEPRNLARARKTLPWLASVGKRDTWGIGYIKGSRNLGIGEHTWRSKCRWFQVGFPSKGREWQRCPIQDTSRYPRFLSQVPRVGYFDTFKFVPVVRQPPLHFLQPKTMKQVKSTSRGVYLNGELYWRRGHLHSTTAWLLHFQLKWTDLSLPPTKTLYGVF